MRHRRAIEQGINPADILLNHEHVSQIKYFFQNFSYSLILIRLNGLNYKFQKNDKNEILFLMIHNGIICGIW